MHAVKGAWVGQTFALAKRNESEVRKSRIRRSKEERKAMVETFIKKYQESNNGSFPSLNLTHKEVGGSFYTVREIVRDIIQENRVLGPAKFTLEEHPSDQVLERDLLGSIAVDPNTYLAASPNENHHEPSNLKGTSEKMLSGEHIRVEVQLSDNGNVLNGSQVSVRNKEFNEAYGNGNVISDSQVDETNQELAETCGNGNLIHGSQVDQTNKDSVEASSPDFQAIESLATEEDVTQNLAVPITNLSPVTADVVVETFPIRSVTRTAIGTESSGESRELINSSENETKNLGLHIGKARSELESVELMKNSNLLDEKSVDDLGNTFSSGIEEEGKNVGYTLVKSTMQAALEEHFAHDNEICADLQVKAPHQSNILTAEVIEQSQTISGAKTKIQDGFHAKTKEGQERTNEHEINGQLGGNTQKSNPTLDRINLESWDGTPGNSTKQHINPFVAVFRAFVDAFVKFWSE
ncbi:uncharacterized protein LOC129298013 [Prosopis cineraria]|uniref:uncharacterized protein LOC129298013 n=1 Tax=Prosopis cineraria TaxID=364024 RepID=UPI00240EA039|nr:uncharacterized protein LOC129298013 [Prosopis cineraria]